MRKNQHIELFDEINILHFSTCKALIFEKILPVLTYSGIAGLIVGAVVSIFNFALHYFSAYALKELGLVIENLEFLPLYVAQVFFVATVMYWLIKFFPEARGSGIPRTEAMLLGKRKLNWWRLAIATVFGSFLSFSTGLSVGAEGPSVQLSASLALGVEGINNKPTKRRYIANGGVAAGIATAFGAPFTGILFAQEEVQRKFNPLMVAGSAIAVLYSQMMDNIISNALHIKPKFFGSALVVGLPNNFIWMALIIGISVAVFANFFNRFILLLDSSARKSKLPRWVTIYGVFAISAIIGLLLPNSMGGGYPLINSLFGMEIDLENTAILFFIKFFLICLCFRSGVTGGMMIPMLSLGALFGSLLGYMFMAFGMPAECFSSVTLITMCAFFGTSITAPVTIVCLCLETTNGYDYVLPLLIAVAISYLLSKLFKQKPLYDALAEHETDTYLEMSKISKM